MGGAVQLRYAGLFERERAKTENVAYVVTRSSDGKFEEVYDQMDLYLPGSRRAAVSLRMGSVGYEFWKVEFLRQVREALTAR